MKFLFVFISLLLVLNPHEDLNPYFFELEGVVYQFNDPSIDCRVNVDKDFLWNFHKAITPCYKTMDIAINDEGKSIRILNSDGTSSSYEIDTKGSVRLLENVAKDPIFSKPATLKYKKGLEIIKKKFDVNDQWTGQDILRYMIEPPTELLGPQAPQSYSKLELELAVKLLVKSEAQNQIFLPFNSRRISLLSYQKDYSLSKAFLITENGKLPLNKSLQLKLIQQIKSAGSLEWKYWSKEAPHILAELSFDSNYNCNSFDFYHTEAPKGISFCNKKASNIFLFPNPSFGKVKILMEQMNTGAYSFVIYNIIGKEILKAPLQVNSEEELIDLNLSHLSRGTYLYAIVDGEGRRQITKKLVILGI